MHSCWNACHGMCPEEISLLSSLGWKLTAIDIHFYIIPVSKEHVGRGEKTKSNKQTKKSPILMYLFCVFPHC